MLRGLYNEIKNGKLILASFLGFCRVRLIARFDYWALIISDLIPQIPVYTRSVLSGIRRMKIGFKSMTVCNSQSKKL